jgi:uncharacterized protein (TIGR04141 family)
VPNLTIHLLRASVQHHRDAVGVKANYLSIDVGERHIGDLYVAPKPERPPPWANVFRGYIEDLNDLGSVKSTGAVLIVKSKGRFFALSFGQGRFILNQDMIEERFGLLATLNSLEANALRSIDKRTFDAVDQNSRVQVGLTSNASDFGIDIERDLIKGIVGYPKKIELLGRRMSGSDALTVSRDIDLGSIRKALDAYLRAYESDAYKEHFSWIDQIHQVRKKGHLASSLDDILVESLNSVRSQGGKGGNCWLAAPEVLDWDVVEGFRYSQSKRDGYQTDMHLPGFFATIEGIDLSVELLKMRHVYAVNADHVEVKHWTIYKCIHCEVEREGKSYLLSGGQWFEIKRDFVDSINEFFDAIPIFGIGLPDYKHAKEADYNAELCESNQKYWALMDLKQIKIGGVYDKVEFCDAYGAGMELLHIKHYGSSNLLGHLFNQGLVSGELLREHPDYVKLVNMKLPKEFALTDGGVPRSVEDYTIVFGIISQSDEKKLRIPFFARVALKNVCRRLESIGYKKIYIAKISVDDGFKMTTKIPSAKRRRRRKSGERSA